MKKQITEKKKSDRKFISFYLPYYDENGDKISKVISLPFNMKKENDKNLYDKIKDIPGGDIKNEIAIHSYTQLLKTAEQENRTPADLMKQRIKEMLNKDKYIQRSIKIKKTSFLSMIKYLESIEKRNPKEEDIYIFLKSIIKIF